jgi:protein-L-isoaspartate(D-aspartate) O-methyltransferase
LSSEVDQYAAARWAMVEEQIRRRKNISETVLRAMRSVPRHEFVPVDLIGRAYEDGPLPIGGGQTISQPYIVAAMTDDLEIQPNDKILEIGTGCGYQAAVLGSLAREVHSVELRAVLSQAAAERLSRLGYSNVHVHCADGSLGWPLNAPYDGILVAAAAPKVPEAMLQQLAHGGRMIVPVGEEAEQVLMFVRRKESKFSFDRRDSCRFVPLLGRYGWRVA